MSTALKIVKQKHAELVKIGKKAHSVQGYRKDLAEEHLLGHLTQMSNKWCSVDCMARIMFGRNSEENRNKIRKRIGPAFRYLLGHGKFLVIDYDDSRKGRGRIRAMKFFEGGAGAEGQYALHQIERMTARQKMSEEMRVQALALVGVSP